jgi:hypothetical protein
MNEESARKEKLVAETYRLAVYGEVLLQVARQLALAERH